MAKLPAFQFYTGDWVKDPQLSMCSPSTRGIWIDVLCAMHELGRTGQVTGTVDQLCRLCRCTAAEMSAALAELESTQTASVSERNGTVTVVCRRMQREHKERVTTKNRVQKHRGNGDVAEKKRESNNPSSSSTTNNPPALRAVESPSSDHKRLMTELQNRSGPISDGGAQGKAVKWLLRHYDVETCLRCLDSLKAEDWRKTRVSWLTVEKEIGDWLVRQEPKVRSNGLVL